MSDNSVLPSDRIGLEEQDRFCPEERVQHLVPVVPVFFLMYQLEDCLINVL